MGNMGCLAHHSSTPILQHSGFPIHFLIHSTISRAMSSGDLFFTTLVSRLCFGSDTLAKDRPSAASLEGLAFWSAGITVRMLTIPTCGLFLGSGRLPVAQPSRAGGPAQRETW